MPLRIFQQIFPDQVDRAGRPTSLDPTLATLTAYNKTRIPCNGTFTAKTEWLNEGGPHYRASAKWFVADAPGPALLGLPTSEKLKVVKMNCAVKMTPAVKVAPITTAKSGPSIKTTADLIKEYPDRFKGIGKLPGKYRIHLREDAKPVIHPPQKCPIALQSKVKAKLDEMEKLNIICKVDEPTDWVSSLAYASKESGEIRICLDPRDLNKAICRDHHRTLTTEEVTHAFAGSKFFTKLDASHAYWHVELDEESSHLTAFNSPFGDTDSSDSLLGWSVPRMVSRRRWTRP